MTAAPIRNEAGDLIGTMDIAAEGWRRRPYIDLRMDADRRGSFWKALGSGGITETYRVYRFPVREWRPAFGELSHFLSLPSDVTEEDLEKFDGFRPSEERAKRKEAAECEARCRVILHALVDGYMLVVNGHKAAHAQVSLNGDLSYAVARVVPKVADGSVTLGDLLELEGLRHITPISKALPDHEVANWTIYGAPREIYTITDEGRAWLNGNVLPEAAQ